jgi:hypothetical protein
MYVGIHIEAQKMPNYALAVWSGIIKAHGFYGSQGSVLHKK